MKIIWIDDEIELLKPHCIFLENKGYKVIPINNAQEAIELIDNENFSAVLLDENMPGINGLDALILIKEKHPNLPVIMVTKNEEESIMEQAIGRQISDYILKPVNPNQILLSLKKIFSDKLLEEKAITDFQIEFRKISLDLIEADDIKDWFRIYQKLIYWELRLDSVNDQNFIDLLKNTKREANQIFSDFIEDNYLNLLKKQDIPLSHTVFKEWCYPQIKENKTLLLVVDNLRYDQWKSIEPLFRNLFSNFHEQPYLSILPTTTQYARNAFFSGMMPSEIEKKFPNLWLNDNDEGNKNQFEKEYLANQLQNLRLDQIQNKYLKILNVDFEKKLFDEFNQYKNLQLLTIVYNFIDILSHSKTENKIIGEMIRDDSTFRSITKNWFENSYLLKIVRLAAENGFQVILTTDHGTVLTGKPSQVIGDRESSTNIRYKTGKNLQFESKDVMVVSEPEKFFLPKSNVSSKYIFAKRDCYLVYPKNYNYYVNYYKNTYQHGGISLEEMIIPFVVMKNG